MSQPTSPILPYAPRLPWHRRRAFRRALQLLILLAGLVLLYLLLPPAWRRAQLAYYRHQCNTYVFPKDSVVFETDPAAATRLLAANSQYHDRYSLGPVLPPIAAWRPACWSRWVHLENGLPPDITVGIEAPPILFLHERTPADGASPALVVIQYSEPDPYAPLLGRVADPRHQFLIQICPRNASYSTTYGSLILDIPPTDPRIRWKAAPKILRFYAGQTDPTDPSAFSIDFETDAGRQTLHARLLSQNQLTLESAAPSP